MNHEFTPVILAILQENFKDNTKDIYEKSPLLQYLNTKTVSAGRGSKARSGFANLFAIYVLVEDYLKGDYDTSGKYSEYEGARFVDLFIRQRELPFGSKLQNHALNARLNDEFNKYFPQLRQPPIIRNVETNRYWINENLLKIQLGKDVYNIAPSVLEIITAYIQKKRDAFEGFINKCEELKSIEKAKPKEVEVFVYSLLAPNVDARLFEIVSYAILKYFFINQIVYFGFTPDDLDEEPLTLYKTGRTNANDGGIDFVMRPLGRFFQVTETLDVKKYFLDIDKIQHYPISFVIKSNESIEALRDMLEKNAQALYPITSIIKKYMDSIEEIINIPMLQDYFSQTIKNGDMPNVLDEIILQSKVEFNFVDDEE